MKNIVMLEEVECFDIKQILESGQVFRFKPVSDTSYILIAKQKAIRITQQPGSTSIMLHNTTAGELEEMWIEYFDIPTDYKNISDILQSKDTHMKEAIEFGSGIRILKQDPWEMLISFIISQNKAIPHIKQCIENISQAFGEEIEAIDGYDEDPLYGFPTPTQLAEATEEELRTCKVGFRAPYIMDACRKIVDGDVCLTHIYNMSIEEGRAELMKIKGVGPKIADCILLFAYGKTEVFPTDVWIKRVIEGLYFEEVDQKLTTIQQFARDYYGDLAGYAQQYLFFYGRENALFKNIKIN